MHELSIAQGIVRIAMKYAELHKAERVARIDITIGALSGVESEALSFCFPFAAEGTVCEGAELGVTIEKGKGSCEKCGASVEVSDLMTVCPACGNWPLKVEGGNEMLIKSLEVI
ncbi:MAG: hydrogenase maturation nickel metallochaperone HypA [Myxococcota bacterium]